ncbi:MAG: AMP-binding protein, partial [Solirubrobacterales bacterium]
MDAGGAGAGQGELLWEPSAESIERSTMTRYMRWLGAERGRSFDDYASLWAWSVGELEEFWASIWDFFEVEASAPYSTVLAERTMPGARWFEGAELNFAEHVFRGKPDDEVAVLHASELRELGELRWGELRRQVAEVAAALHALDVEPGDRVVAYMPNIPETLVAFLACASIGAVWSSCSPDFGASSVIDRFAQIEPKVLFAVDGYRYSGKDFDRLDTVAGIARQIPSLERIVVVPYLSASPELGRLENGGQPPPMTLGQLRELGTGVHLSFEQVPFDHPLWVLYSSGTTGLPKAIVQGHGGILLEHLKKL